MDAPKTSTEAATSKIPMSTGGLVNSRTTYQSTYRPNTAVTKPGTFQPASK